MILVAISLLVLAVCGKHHSPFLSSSSSSPLVVSSNRALDSSSVPSPHRKYAPLSPLVHVRSFRPRFSLDS